MKAESLQARDLDFDSFLASNFDDFQSFAWGPNASNPAARDPTGRLDGFCAPSSLNEVRDLRHIFVSNIAKNICIC